MIEHNWSKMIIVTHLHNSDIEKIPIEIKYIPKGKKCIIQK